MKPFFGCDSLLKHGVAGVGFDDPVCQFKPALGHLACSLSTFFCSVKVCGLHHCPLAVVRSDIQRSMSSSRHATARADKRTGAGNVPAFMPA
jgi:hypothetical protein